MPYRIAEKVDQNLDHAARFAIGQGRLVGAYEFELH